MAEQQQFQLKQRVQVKPDAAFRNHTEAFFMAARYLGTITGIRDEEYLVEVGGGSSIADLFSADELEPIDAPAAAREALDARLAEMRELMGAIPEGEYVVWEPQPNYAWRAIGLKVNEDNIQIAEVSTLKILRGDHVEDRTRLPEFYAAAPQMVRELLALVDAERGKARQGTAPFEALWKQFSADNRVEPIAFTQWINQNEHLTILFLALSRMQAARPE